MNALIFVRRSVLFVLALLIVGGCAPHRVSEYARESPVFDLRRFFDGPVVAHGVVQDRAGRVIRRMRVDISCSWQGDVGTLDEAFTYADGKKERRVWTIRKDGDRYVGTAADVIGEAAGEAAGNALRWRYVLALPVDGTVYHLDFDDWMWQLDERILINRATYSKFGYRLGEVLITFIRP